MLLFFESSQLLCGTQKVRQFLSNLRRSSFAEEATVSVCDVTQRKLSTGFCYKWVMLLMPKQWFNVDFVANFRLRDEKSAVKTLWPVACREFIFLPEFKVQHRDLEEKYEVISFVAKGSFGRVYKVRRLIDSQVFALKILEKAKVRRWNWPESTSSYQPIFTFADNPRRMCATIETRSYHSEDN